MQGYFGRENADHWEEESELFVRWVKESEVFQAIQKYSDAYSSGDTEERDFSLLEHVNRFCNALQDRAEATEVAAKSTEAEAAEVMAAMAETTAAEAGEAAHVAAAETDAAEVDVVEVAAAPAVTAEAEETTGSPSRKRKALDGSPHGSDSGSGRRARGTPRRKRHR